MFVFMRRRVGAGTVDPLGACSIIKKHDKGKTKVTGLRKAAIEHLRYVKGTTMYPLEHSLGDGMLCSVPGYLNS